MDFGGKPVQIISIKDGKLALDKNALESILLQADLKNDPVLVLSVAGLLRKGKSFLLNLLIKYLSSHCSEYWMDDGDTRLSGFEWGGGPDGITTGVWMWSKLFSITGPKREKIRVVLIDTQGTMDPQANTDNDAAMFALSSAVSSIQVYNAVAGINEGDIHFLELCTRYGRAIKDEENSSFQTLTFLIRDWPHVKKYPYGETGGSQHLKSIMDAKVNMKSRETLRNGFKNLMCFLLPHPGMKVMLGNTDGEFADLDIDFRKQIDVLFKRFMSSDITQPLLDNDKPVTCEGLLNYFLKYMKNIESGELFVIDNPAEANAKAWNGQVFREVIEKVDEVLRKNFDSYHENIDTFFRGIREEALEVFTSKCKFNKSKTYDKLFNDLKSKIEMKFQTYNATMNVKLAKASTQNLHAFEKALSNFKRGMHEVCSAYMIPDKLKEALHENNKVAMESFLRSVNNFGPSHKKFEDELKRALSREHEIFQDMNKRNHDKEMLDKKLIEKEREQKKQQEEATKRLQAQTKLLDELMHAGRLREEQEKEKNLQAMKLMEQQRKEFEKMKIQAAEKDEQARRRTEKIYEEMKRQEVEREKERKRQAAEREKERQEKEAEIKALKDQMERNAEIKRQEIALLQARQMKVVGFEKACTAYANKLKEIYANYQEPHEYNSNHTTAIQCAMGEYNGYLNENMPADIFEKFEKSVNQTRETYETQNDKKIENAKSKNDAAHDKALTFYRNAMATDKEFLSAFGFDDYKNECEKNAKIEYEMNSEKEEYKSYEENERDLQNAITYLNKMIDKERTWWRKSLRFFRAHKIADIGTLVIPARLLKQPHKQ